ncbi:MAG: AMP-binding protein [Ilumatobacteraceae bacterium]
MNLAHLLDPHPAADVAIVSRNRPTTYGELREQIAQFRGGLAGLGVEPGDRVAIACGNDRYFVISYLATIGIGAVAVPLNPSSPAPELQHELAVVEPVAIIIEPSVVATWSDISPTAVPSVEHVVVTEGAPPGEHRALDELLAAEPAPIVDVDSDTLAVMMFTSGTAGAPRAAMLSHRNLASNIEQALSARDHVTRDDTVYGVLPLFHIFGLNVLLGIGLTVGARLVLVQRFDPATAVESIASRGVTVVPGAPPMWVAFAHFDELPGDAFASVRIAFSGASRLPPAIAERCEERFGLKIAEGYGLTEASPVVTSSAGMEPRYGSVGRSVSGVEVRLVGDDGGDVVVGDTGEIWVRGENVFQGYYREPEATARVLDRDGWLHTGDLATVDDDGWLYLVDRSKDLIIVSGFNVYPAEVEDVLVGHPAVAEVGVIGVAHPHTGEAVKAFVVLVPGADVDEDTLIEYAGEHLARYKCPSKIIFADALPHNISGKLLRRHLDTSVLAEP